MLLHTSQQGPQIASFPKDGHHAIVEDATPGRGGGWPEGAYKAG